MKTNEIYEAPQLEVAEIAAEQGFAASASGIDNPLIEDEDSGYWG